MTQSTASSCLSRQHRSSDAAARAGDNAALDRYVYLDNASTSGDKSVAAIEAMVRYATHVVASPSRGAHRLSREASRIVDDARDAVAELVGAPDGRFIAFTSNATHGLNLAIQGCLSNGDHVITTAVEHNSVLRPLEALKRRNEIDYSVVAPGPNGEFDLAQFKAAFTSRTRLVVLNHASNVTGVVTPVRPITELAHALGALVLVDASQSAGQIDVRVDEIGCDFLALTGHKSLRGPSGTGALFVRDPESLRPLLQGGSGNNSKSLIHPAGMPDRLEAGTLNYMGIAGLGAALRELLARDSTADRARSVAMTRRLIAGCAAIHGVSVLVPEPIYERVAVVSVVHDVLDSGELAALLEERGIITRPGLHCAPLVHELLGTIRTGAVRFSLSRATSYDNVDRAVEALSAAAQGVRS